MGFEVTHEAAEVLTRSMRLGGLDPTTGGIRLRGALGLGGGLDVQVELAEGPLAGEEVVESGTLRLFIDPRVGEAMPDAIVTVEPQHETVVVRPR